ncbi:hypothetical protein H1D32_07235 [Anaerobacillus sp. CMMVII]|uniref:hypothetical protein n=1 Tax=Anaerobacillus sp. CMMVII TaxID=2755588 RepID=UPI0021B83958|nr:hypothetical protein [Anaerobacillus sp. CMMVII]MCT8137559.1 hypothetical protein [Anaerobacillus sp. CMMVII]
MKLYRGSTLVATQQVKSTVVQYNFASKMTRPGVYTVTVRAIGDGTNYKNGAVSLRSNEKKK